MIVDNNSDCLRIIWYEKKYTYWIRPESLTWDNHATGTRHESLSQDNHALGIRHESLSRDNLPIT